MGRAGEGAALALLLFLWRVAVSPAAVASRACGVCIYQERKFEPCRLR